MPEITGTIQDEREQLYVGPILFENLDAPCSAGARVTGIATTEAITEDDGALPDDFALAPGRTRLIVNGRKSKVFTVPTGTGPYDLAALMQTAAAGSNRVILIAETIEELRDFPAIAGNKLAFVLSDANGGLASFVFDTAITTDNLDAGEYAATDGNGGWRRKGL